MPSTTVRRTTVGLTAVGLVATALVTGLGTAVAAPAGSTLGTTEPRAGATLSIVGPRTVAFGRPARYSVQVTATTGTVGGTVVLRASGRRVDQAVAGPDGLVALTIARRELHPGQRVARVRYVSTDREDQARASRPLTITKAETVLRARDVEVAAGERAQVVVNAGPAKARPVGPLQATIGGVPVGRTRLEPGGTTLRLRAIDEPGRYRVRVRYEGSGDAKPAATSVRLRVTA